MWTPKAGTSFFLEEGSGEKAPWKIVENGLCLPWTGSGFHYIWQEWSFVSNCMNYTSEQNKVQLYPPFINKYKFIWLICRTLHVKWPDFTSGLKRNPWYIYNHFCLLLTTWKLQWADVYHCIDVLNWIECWVSVVVTFVILLTIYLNNIHLK